MAANVLSQSGRSPRRRDKPRRGIARRLFKVTGYGLLGFLAALFLLVLVFRWVPLPTSAFILGHKWKGGKPEYTWVAWQYISEAMPIAVVAAEDQRFLDHRGFDFEAIKEAIKENRWRDKPRGASTLSQQVAKNLFLWHTSTWLRKGLETGLTVVIEICWPKKRILEVYLNVAQFGPRTFGVHAASRRYFGIPASRLDDRQAALLAAVLPSPGNYSLAPPSEFVRRRADQIQQQVRLMGGPAFLAPLNE
ncbi:monofunctional biosynthetic peptidoglycan transglycosylase [Desulfatitalea alkaliphila]|uniref:Biosynthetic peptidoglycan transglycosylase n=1 Tax=Desulfatitalea alkaliphila TaxID=2929485 RepID=A0AA41UKU4_9BACT|nr:monofunctional biosynthetic peptidoglycan transglycosylase [Desulfatitalea alkaliphila]MCJ8502649.1 monofunctional biosynthetic peptidoglycan transglycosylase [Desulfatitalea alkaliphila]